MQGFCCSSRRGVFSSRLTIWQIPMSVYTMVSVGYAELEGRVRPCGPLGNYLTQQLIDFNAAHGLNMEYRTLGDSPAIGVVMNPSGAIWRDWPRRRFTADCQMIPSDGTSVLDGPLKSYRTVDADFVNRTVRWLSPLTRVGSLKTSFTSWISSQRASRITTPAANETKERSEAFLASGRGCLSCLSYAVGHGCCVGDEWQPTEIWWRPGDRATGLLGDNVHTFHPGLLGTAPHCPDSACFRHFPVFPGPGIPVRVPPRARHTPSSEGVFALTCVSRWSGPSDTGRGVPGVAGRLFDCGGAGAGSWLVGPPLALYWGYAFLSCFSG
jgi:hypothetical protein